MSKAKTRVFLRGYKVMANIGVHPHEHEGKQLISVDAELKLASTIQPTADRIGETLNYEWLVAVIEQVCARGHVQLVETLNHRIAETCLQDDRVHSVRVRIEKPGAIANADAAGAELILHRDKSSLQ